MRRAKAQREEVTGPDEEEESTDWKDTLLGALKAMEPAAFERLPMRLLREAGFRNVEVLGKSGDGGIDGIGVYRVSLKYPTELRERVVRMVLEYQGVHGSVGSAQGHPNLVGGAVIDQFQFRVGR